MTWLYHAYNVMLIPQYETPSQCHDISQVAWGLLHLLPTEVEGGASTISVTSSAIGEGYVITADVFFFRVLVTLWTSVWTDSNEISRIGLVWSKEQFVKLWPFRISIWVQDFFLFRMGLARLFLVLLDCFSLFMHRGLCSRCASCIIDDLVL